ncbi:MAG: DNA repair protein RadC [Syntrophomonadaceae bacterium]|nr:DNA repair protein RadC [Syntrophomonadaceae bacterium]
MDYHITIKDLPEGMRPREKLLNQGEQALSLAEIIAILLGSGTREKTAVELADYLLARYQGLRYLREASFEELSSVKGIGPAKAARFKAALELGRRLAMDFYDRPVIKTPEDVKNMVMEDMRLLDREHFRAAYLDRKNHVISIETISIGGLHSSIVHPREVFKPAVKRSAAGVILIHNHPSGDPSPSQEDIEVTRRLVQAGQIMGIEVLDHIIIGDRQYYSMKGQGII